MHLSDIIFSMKVKSLLNIICDLNKNLKLSLPGELFKTYVWIFKILF